LRKNRQDGAAVQAKGRAVRAFTATDDFVYIGLWVLLGASALALLGRSVVDQDARQQPRRPGSSTSSWASGR